VSSDYRLIYHRDAVKFIVKQEKASQERITQAIDFRGNIYK
jgi:hypothetical protein